MPKAEIHGLFVEDGMAHWETSELGREGVEVRTKKYISWVCTPIMGVAAQASTASGRICCVLGEESACLLLWVCGKIPWSRAGSISLVFNADDWVGYAKRCPVSRCVSRPQGSGAWLGAGTRLCWGRSIGACWWARCHLDPVDLCQWWRWGRVGNWSGWLQVRWCVHCWFRGRLTRCWVQYFYFWESWIQDAERSLLRGDWLKLLVYWVLPCNWLLT